MLFFFFFYCYFYLLYQFVAHFRLAAWGQRRVVAALLSPQRGCGTAPAPRPGVLREAPALPQAQHRRPVSLCPSGFGGAGCFMQGPLRTPVPGPDLPGAQLQVSVTWRTQPASNVCITCRGNHRVSRRPKTTAGRGGIH